jgi:hypothetical protein
MFGMMGGFGRDEFPMILELEGQHNVEFSLCISTRTNILT